MCYVHGVWWKLKYIQPLSDTALDLCLYILTWCQNAPPLADAAYSILFVKLEELHIVTARKPLIHQNQPVAQYLHKIQPCML